MTLKEIAQEAGVSISTVSRVINSTNTKVASKEVQEKIWEIVRRTGYEPNTHARSLQQGSDPTKINPHSLACLFARTPTSPNDPFFSTLAQSVEKEAFKQNYTVKSSFTPFDLSHPESHRLLIDSGINGVVILGRSDKSTFRFLKQHCRNVVYTGLNGIDAKYDQVLCNGQEASFCAVEHLISLGHKYIGYIGETQNENRYLGYLAALKKHNLPFDEAFVASAPLFSSEGYTGANLLLQRCPQVTAFFCCNDITAIGAMRAVRDAGLKIPKDISIVSIDDIDTAQYLSPMLTTVHIPIAEMGQIATKILIDRITGGHTLPMITYLPFYLARRDSCAPPSR